MLLSKPLHASIGFCQSYRIGIIDHHARVIRGGTRILTGRVHKVCWCKSYSIGQHKPLESQLTKQTPPPSPNRENSDNEEANLEDEDGDISDEENSDTSGSESGSDSSIDREIRSFEERNRELVERMREVEEETIHHVEIQEGWRRAIVALEAKLDEMRAVVEVARGGGPAVGFSDHDYETMNAIEKEVDYLQRLMAADEGYQEGHQAEPEIDANGQNQMNNAQ